MIDYAAINYTAVLVAAIASFLLGAIWFSPPVFGPAWLRALGKTKEEVCGRQRYALAITAVTTWITAYVLAVIMLGLKIASAWGGAIAGLSIGVGIVATSMLSDYLFCNFRIKLFFIQAGHRVIYLVIMGAILGAWR
ncbi:MAG: DUF1761 domain-containing protein [Nitrospirota bacterium]